VQYLASNIGNGICEIVCFDSTFSILSYYAKTRKRLMKIKHEIGYHIEHCDLFFLPKRPTLTPTRRELCKNCYTTTIPDAYQG